MTELEEAQAKIAEMEAAAVVSAADMAKLSGNQNKLMDEAKSAKESAVKLKQQAADIQLMLDEKNKGAGNFEDLLKSAEGQNAQLQSEKALLSTEIATANATIANQIAVANALTVDTFAAQLAAQHASNGEGSLKLAAAQIAKRLSADEGKLGVLDTSGNPSTITTDKLLEELKIEFPVIFSGSKASGSGAGGGSGGGGGAVPKTLAECKGDRDLEIAFHQGQIDAR